MMAFYAVRGHSLDELANLTFAEKAFLHCAREEYYKEIKAMFGERG
jgi:hypothetical protein